MMAVIRSIPEDLLLNRIARNPIVEAYVKPKMDGKEYPENLPATWIRVDEGLGLSITGPRTFPKIHIPAKLARASRAARHPPIHQDSPTVRAMRNRFHGGLAVEETKFAHSVDAGVIP